jgi:hypothetical protein
MRDHESNDLEGAAYLAGMEEMPEDDDRPSKAELSLEREQDERDARFDRSRPW